MLHVHHAGRAERLVDALVELLAVPPDDPFIPEVVAVPSRAVQRWLEQQLARRLGTSGSADGLAHERADGVAANVLMPFPGRLLRPRLTPPGEGRAPLVSHAALDADPWQPGPLAWRLLHVAPEAGVQLGDAARAHHVAELFDRYAVYRPSLLHAWAAGHDRDADGQPLDPALRWQPRLWRAAADSLRERTLDPATRLREAVDALATDPSLADLPGRLAVLALGALPASSLVLLDALALHRDVHVLLLHPSPAWWAATAATSVPPGLPPHPRTLVDAHHPLLVTWGQVAYETQQALRAGSDGGTRPARWHAHDDEPPVPEPLTLLGRLQRDLRLDRAPGDGPAHRWDLTDHSVQIHACHGLARQVEVLRDTIAHLLADDERLAPSDVVVLCADLDRARPLVASTLGPLAGGATVAATGGAPRFPLTLADASSRSSAVAPGAVDDPLVDAFLAVLRAARGRATATAVVSLASLAPVRRRLGFSDTDIARLDGWIEAANVRWGLDATHLAEHELPADVAVTGWEAALDRLLLGVAMAPDEHRVGLGDRRPSRDVGPDDAPGIGRLAELVHRLRLLRTRLGGRAPASTWSELLRDVAGGFLAPDPAQPWQSRRLARLLDQLDGDRAVAGADVDPELSVDDVLSLLSTAWQQGGGSANWGAGGITVCSLGELRGVPFPVVCILGLDDEAVRAATNAPDDLLARSPRTGDRDARSEQRAVLLDALLAARHHLVITHDGHDVRTNQPLAPAVPLAELLDVIDATTSPRSDTVGTSDRPVSDRLVLHHPRQAFAEACLRPGGLGRSGPWSFDPDALAGAESRRRDRTAPAELCDLLLPATSPDEVSGVITIAELGAALCDPIGTFLSRGLGLRLPRTPEERSDLVPTTLEALGRWQLVQHLLDLRSRPDLTPADADARWLQLARADGMLPVGRFADRAVTAARAAVDAIATTLDERGLPLRAAGSHEVEITLPDGRRLVGTVTGVHPGDRRDTLVRARSGAVRAKDVLPVAIELLALAASGHPCDAFLVGASGPEAVHEAPAVVGDARAATVALAALVELAERCTRSALPIPVALGAAWAEALHHPKRKYRTPTDAWKHDLHGAAVQLVFGQLDEHQVAARRALDDHTPAPHLARLLWGLLAGVPG